MEFAFFAIIPDSSQHQVLAVREHGRWTLPRFTVETPSFKWPAPMNAVVTGWLRTPVTARRYLHNLATASGNETWAVVFEVHAAQGW